MGCSKNLIDSERLLKRLNQRGYTVEHDSEEPSGEYVVVNTCGFINDAKEESINLLLELSEAKKEGRIGKVVVMGCLSQRYMDDLKAELPDIDIWYGKFDWKDFIDRLPDLSGEAKPKEWERQLTTPPHSAYIKISEGCNRFCAFCAIPLITGRHTSRPIEEICEEVRSLVNDGVKEFNIIAQDLSSYGLDLYDRHALAELVERLAMIPGVEWIRLHYAYPSDFPEDILDVMARHKNVCSYLDIALQHSSNHMLERMNRHITAEETELLLAKMREKVPDIKIRTTLMVGFPGETDEDFEDLLKFVKRQKFDRMGAFAYSEEEDTFAAKNYGDDVPPDVKQHRLDRLMALQEEIAWNSAEALEGKKIRILIDDIEGDYRIGRSEWDSPEVDCCFYVSGTDAQPGDFINVKVVEARSPFDFMCVPVK